MRTIVIVLAAVALTGCAGKTRLVPQAYMPEPPALLMKEPMDLQTIKDEEETPETLSL